jgi:hypothetical protein
MSKTITTVNRDRPEIHYVEILPDNSALIVVGGCCKPQIIRPDKTVIGYVKSVRRTYKRKKAVLRSIDQCIEFAIKWAYANYQT